MLFAVVVVVITTFAGVVEGGDGGGDGGMYVEVESVYDNEHTTSPSSSSSSSSSSGALLPFDMDIHVIAYNRPQSLAVLCSSLLRGRYGPSLSSIHFHIDFSNDNPSITSQVAQVAHAFAAKWRKEHSRVPVFIRVRSENAGLVKNVIEAWYPTSDREFGIFLEDDSEVSELFYEYSERMVGFFLSNSEHHRTHNFDLMLGLSLYNGYRVETSGHDRVFGHLGRPYLMNTVESWGAVFFPIPWRQFRDYYAQSLHVTHLSPWVPYSFTNQYVQSWKRWAVRFVVEGGLYMLETGLELPYSLVVNHLKEGVHTPSNAKLHSLAPTVLLNDTVAAKIDFWNRMRASEYDHIDAYGRAIGKDPKPWKAMAQELSTGITEFVRNGISVHANANCKNGACIWYMNWPIQNDSEKDNNNNNNNMDNDNDANCIKTLRPLPCEGRDVLLYDGTIVLKERIEPPTKEKTVVLVWNRKEEEFEIFRSSKEQNQNRMYSSIYHHIVISNRSHVGFKFISTFSPSHVYVIHHATEATQIEYLEGQSSTTQTPLTKYEARKALSLDIGEDRADTMVVTAILQVDRPLLLLTRTAQFLKGYMTKISVLFLLGCGYNDIHKCQQYSDINNDNSNNVKMHAFLVENERSQNSVKQTGIRDSDNGITDVLLAAADVVFDGSVEHRGFHNFFMDALRLGKPIIADELEGVHHSNLYGALKDSLFCTFHPLSQATLTRCFEKAVDAYYSNRIQAGLSQHFVNRIMDKMNDANEYYRTIQKTIELIRVNSNASLYSSQSGRLFPFLFGF